MQTKINDQIMKEIQHHIADTLKSLRSQGEEKQVTLAGELGIARSILSDYENAKRMPTLEHLIKIAEHYQVSCDYLIGTDSILYNDDIYATDYASIDVSSLSYRDKIIVNFLVQAMKLTAMTKSKDDNRRLLSQLLRNNKKEEFTSINKILKRKRKWQR